MGPTRRVFFLLPRSRQEGIEPRLRAGRRLPPAPPANLAKPRPPEGSPGSGASGAPRGWQGGWPRRGGHWPRRADTQAMMGRGTVPRQSGRWGEKGRRTLDAFLVRRGGGEKPALARIGVEAGGGTLTMEGAGGHEGGEGGCLGGARERGGPNRGERELGGSLKWARPRCTMGSIHGHARVSLWRDKEGEGGGAR